VDNAGGITSFYRDGTDMRAVYQKLKAEGVTASHRILPGGQAVVRLSPHFYNTDDELRRCLELV
jgi:selenocysteine lyase/cysteine desulfurase